LPCQRYASDWDEQLLIANSEATCVANPAYYPS